MKLPRIAAAAVVLLAFSPASAFGQDIAPPGNSAVDQYRESAPPAASGSKKLDSNRRKSLAKQGADGAALAAALDRDGGVPDGRSTAGTDSSTPTTSPGGASGRERTGASSATGSESRSGGDESGGRGRGGSGSTGAPASRNGDRDDSKQTVVKAAADSTVGPVPVWGMIVAAMVVVGLGLVLRRRTSV